MAPSRSVRNSAAVFCCCGGANIRRGSVVGDEVLAVREIDVDVVFVPLCGETMELRNPSKAVAEGSAENSESDQLIESRSSLLSVRRGGLMGVLGIGGMAPVVLRGSPSSGSSSLSIFILCWIANVGCGRAAGGECTSGFMPKRGGGERGPAGVSWPVRVGELAGGVRDPRPLIWTTPDRTDPSGESARSRTGQGGGKNCGCEC